MNLTAPKVLKLRERLATILTMGRQHSQRDENLICVKTGVMALQTFGFHLLYGLDHLLGNQLDFMIYTGKMLSCI